MEAELPICPKTAKAPEPSKATVDLLHHLAASLPHVRIAQGSQQRLVYQVAGKSFIFFRNPRPDAVDPVSGDRYEDVVVFWVGSDEDKQALIQDQHSPFFTTPHFDGHLSVLLRTSRIGELDDQELTEVVHDAWLSRASPARVRRFLDEHSPS